MAGKLAKYALGHPYTHAHTVSQSVSEILRFLYAHGLLPETMETEGNFRSFRELLETWSPKDQQRAIAILTREAAAVFEQWVPGLTVELLVFNPQGTLFSGGRKT